jgi:CBS domain-containing protein
MKTCNEVMTKKPVCCLPDDLATDAAESMEKEHVGSIPVIEDVQTRKLIGIITDRDLTTRIVAAGLDANSTKVESVMTRNVVTCNAGDDFQKAVDAMSKYQLRRIPIVDADNKIVGIISQADVAIHFDQPKKTAAMVKEISQSNAS